MELRQYWSIVRKWYWLLALGLVLAAGTSYAVSKSMTPIYAATVTMQVNQQQNPGTLAYNDLILSQQLVQTYSQLINRRPIIEDVISQLHLSETYQSLSGNVSVSAVRDTELMQVTVRDKDPNEASIIANKVADVFIAQTGKGQRGQVSAARDNLQKQLTQVQKEIDQTTAQINQLHSGASGLAPEAQSAEQTRLSDMLSQYQLVYSQLFKSDQDMALAEVNLGGVDVVDPAVPPTAPVEPRVMLNTLLAAVVGLMVAAGVAFIIEYLDDTVKTGQDVQEAVAVPTFGIVGVLPTAKSGPVGELKRLNGRSSEPRREDGGSPNGNEPTDILIAGDPKSPFGEAYRVLRTNLKFATINRPNRALLVSSCGPGEGKSFTLSNLGIVLAQAGAKVIIVDSDIRRPTLHTAFGLSPAEGLVNLLIADHPGDVARYLQPTKYDGLRVLASGRPLPPNPTELLSSPQMAVVVAALKDESDVVLFDSPPALSVADAAILSAYVDGVLLVVEAGRNRSQILARAKEVLSGPGGIVLGVVLNRFKASHDGYYYQHHYYNSAYQYSRPNEEMRTQLDLVSPEERFNA